MSAPDRLWADQLRAALGPATIGREIVVLETTTSTNDIVLEKAKAGATAGLVVFAEHQTAGRGQRGNAWQSAAGKGLWLSILLRPTIPIHQSGHLTSWAAHNLASSIGQTAGVESRVKPPNDVYIAARKVGGVLVEMRAQPGAPYLAIVGIGLNVNQTAADFPEELRERATSLALVTGREHDRSKIAVALLQNLDRAYPAVVARE